MNSLVQLVCFLCMFIPSNCDLSYCPLKLGSNTVDFLGNDLETCHNHEDLSAKHEYHIIQKREADTTATTTVKATTNVTLDIQTPTPIATVTNSSNAEFEPTTNIPTSAVTPKSPPITTTMKNYDPDSIGDDTNVNGMNTTFDHHRYYQSFTKNGSDIQPYWVNLDDMDEHLVLHKKLSNAYRRALMVNLSFDFPFYGHRLKNITIATGGFIYTGTFVHKWLAATQYIAPLMANFDTSTSSNATVKYLDNGTSLTVQWGNVVLQDNPEYGPFTFQVTLKDTGHIIFAYKEIPVNTSAIADGAHPVKIGLSDAYIVEKTVFFIRKKTIYEYHKIDKKENDISSRTAIIFEPVANCVQYTSCDTCLSAKIDFQCKWCQQVGRCSDSVDRYRQDWLEGGCAKNSSALQSECAALPPWTPQSISQNPIVFPAIETHVVQSSSHVGMLVTVTILLLAMCLCAWMYYAYYHPHTSSGQLLIKYRPSSWSWSRGGAKYTAATMHSIHM